MEMLIRNGTIVNHDHTTKADLYLKDGLINKMGSDYRDENTCIETIDAQGKLIFPGGIDPHVHMNLPTPAGFSSDNFFTGSRAALLGGTTTIIDFVTPQRGQSLTDALSARKAEAAESVVNTRFHVSPVEWRPSTEKEILECVHHHNIKSFKCYMAYKSTVGLDDESLYRVMQVVGNAGGLVTLHCEDGDEIERLRSDLASSSLPATEAHVKSRPPELEAKAVSRAIKLAARAHCPIYIVHVSSRQSLQLIEAAKSTGQVVYAETCPQYLLFDKSRYAGEFEKAAAWVMSPPLRSPADNEALWKGLADGLISTVGTDHCPFMLSQKKQGETDFRRIPNGAGGVEHRLALLYTFGVLKNRFSANRFVGLTSANAAKIFGVFPQKGTIAEGADADLVIWNPGIKKQISISNHHQNSDLNIYDGITTTGFPETVILGGKIISKSMLYQ